MEQFIRREQGRGTFVTSTRQPPPISANMQGLIDNVVAIGAATTGRIISFGAVTPTPDIRDALQLGARAKVHRSVHVRLRDAAPFGLITTHVPLDVARQITERDIEATPMLVLLEARGFHPTWARQSLGAAPADRGTARALAVAVRAPLVRLERVVYGAADRPIEHLVAL